MNNSELETLLSDLMALPAENEWLEFKEAKNGHDFGDIGKYFSALSNEAHLAQKECGWLIFGVKDKPREVVGTSYRKSRESLDRLKHEIAEKTTGRLSFQDIFELDTDEGRVILFQIPPAPAGMPIAWEGLFYGREGGSRSGLNIHKIESIRKKIYTDWSAVEVPEASLEDLDIAAIEAARIQYKIKNPLKVSEVNSWDTATFLDKSKITRRGTITRTALLLLGKEESTHFLSPSNSTVTWILKNNQGDQVDYHHFNIPLILASDAILAKINNPNYRFITRNSLFPAEVPRYDTYVLREALHNCFAHQDYNLNRKINIVEKESELILTNAGSFLPGSIEKVISDDCPQDYYRNPFLSAAMVNLNMIDTTGSGIPKIYKKLRARFFPMPTYELQIADTVKLTIYGHIIDENFTQILAQRTDLNIFDIILLDKVQKRLPISKDQFTKLKKLKLIEGRYPTPHLSVIISQKGDNKASYTKNKGFDNTYYQDLIIQFIKQHGEANRKDFEELLLDKMPDFMSANQKLVRLNNIINTLSKKTEQISNKGSKKFPRWILSE